MALEVIGQKLSKLSILAKKWPNFGLKGVGGGLGSFFDLRFIGKTFLLRSVSAFYGMSISNS